MRTERRAWRALGSSVAESRIWPILTTRVDGARTGSWRRLFDKLEFATHRCAPRVFAVASVNEIGPLESGQTEIIAEHRP